jgi:hypothetical protein
MFISSFRSRSHELIEGTHMYNRSKQHCFIFLDDGKNGSGLHLETTLLCISGTLQNKNNIIDTSHKNSISGTYE